MADRKKIVAGVFGIVILVVGSVAGAVLLGGFGNERGQSNVHDGSNTGNSSPTPTATPMSTHGSANETDNSTVVPTETPTTSPTSSPTPTATPTATPMHTPTPTPNSDEVRTPTLVRRFDEDEIARALRERINDWREEQGLQQFKNSDGSVSNQLSEMAANHSVGMADRGELIHEIDGNASVDRYEINDLRRTCRFKKRDAQYIVTPERNRFEVLGHTYAGREYEGLNGTQFNENETQVAEDIFDSWVENRAHRERLSYENANRIGIGIEINEANEVYVTGNVCGIGQGS